MEPGARGEICLRGGCLMSGYFGRPDATAATIDSDGWLHSGSPPPPHSTRCPCPLFLCPGDVGYVDADGYWFIVDRIKELIKVKGYQVRSISNPLHTARR